jgi:hypothetical protein
MIPVSINDTSKLSKYTDNIFMALVSSTKPAEAIYRHYDAAEDKEAFIAALIGALLLRHKQWQTKG